VAKRLGMSTVLLVVGCYLLAPNPRAFVSVGGLSVCQTVERARELLVRAPAKWEAMDLKGKGVALTYEGPIQFSGLQKALPGNALLIGSEGRITSIAAELVFEDETTMRTTYGELRTALSSLVRPRREKTKDDGVELSWYFRCGAFSLNSQSDRKRISAVEFLFTTNPSHGCAPCR
jgi:hypothetical protein